MTQRNRRFGSACAAGDLIKAKHIGVSQDRLYAHVADLIFDVDLAFSQLESALSIEPPQLANNHIVDAGVDGLMKTMEALDEAGVTYVGAYRAEDASKQVVMTSLGDLRIGWVSHTFSLNGKTLPSDRRWSVDVTPFHVDSDPDTSRIQRQIEPAKSAGCDLVVVALHFGMEWETYPQPTQVAWAHTFADCGADLIIGTHPHVIQPVEIYRPPSDPDRAVPILYSLGSLTTAMASPYAVLSCVANITFAEGVLRGRTRTMLTGLVMTPVVYMAEDDEDDGRRNAALYRLSDLNRSDCVLDDETRAYVESINAFADGVLGPDWRSDIDEAVCCA
ncbi:MAG: CapA family protein [Deltaproteobacteria bacterium]|nr:CapA family protein [Deltaproteobacteria bacterium]